MTHPEGGFYSAEDADSVIDPANPKEKGEGAFTFGAPRSSKASSPKFAAIYGVEPTATCMTIRTANSRARTFCMSARADATSPPS